jgi:ketosteroid isomerase-like protein
MSIDRQTVSRWLDAYVAAWQSYDADAIAALFSEDATYAWHPWDSGDDVVRGRAAVVKAWLDDKDAPGTYQAHYEPLAIDGDLAIATGTTRYFDAAGSLEREYYNCFVMHFDEQGRCRAFTEWFMKTPKKGDAAC